MNSILLFLSRLLGRSDHIRVADARESLTYWSRRADELPWRRRTARREARRRVTAARAQLIGAHLEHTRFGAVAPRVTPLLDTRGRSTGGHVRSLAFTSIRRSAIGRKILAVAAGLSAGAVVVGIFAVVLAIHTFG